MVYPFGNKAQRISLLLAHCIILSLRLLPAFSLQLSMSSSKLLTISENVWRTAASNHKRRIKSILQPGLTPREDQINTGNRRKNNKMYDEWTALDPVNPIYNFLIEYYGIKGAKGPRRLARWSPDPALLLEESDNDSHGKSNGVFSTLICTDGTNDVYNAAMKASHGLGGILLENANEDDMGGTLHLRGCTPVISENCNNGELNFHGVLYNPAIFYNRHIPVAETTQNEKNQRLKTISPFQWYSSILQSTLDSEPIMHCHGLHEWAMQYHPEGSPPPPSGKYQSKLPLRVSREVINKTVERKGISCTHVDALRFFAPAAGPLNHHGSQLQRIDQLRLEQKACVHAQMDLLKIALKLNSFIDAELLGDILEISIQARRLDVEASPYDATSFGAGIVPVETSIGRKMYREQQKDLMDRAEPVRIRLLDAYRNFMGISFDNELLVGGDDKSAKSTAYVAPERFAMAEPGGLPWRHNLIES
jgi:hypothetical protein